MPSTKRSLLEIQCQCGYLSVFVDVGNDVQRFHCAKCKRVINRDGKPVGIMRKEGGKVVEYPIV